MFKSILLKEWAKTGRCFLCMVAVVAAVVAWQMIDISKTVDFQGISSLWEDMLEHDSVLISMLQYLPPVAGLVLAVAQYVPEVQQKRLKLTLHLPYPQTRMMLVMYGYGMVLLCLVALCQTMALHIFMRHYLPGVLVSVIIQSTLPWHMAALMAYTWVAAVCLEPTWRMRLAYLCVAAALVGCCYLSPVAGAYNRFVPLLAVWTVLSASVIMTSVGRFKEGKE